MKNTISFTILTIALIFFVEVQGATIKSEKFTSLDDNIQIDIKFEIPSHQSELSEQESKGLVSLKSSEGLEEPNGLGVQEVPIRFENFEQQKQVQNLEKPPFASEDLEQSEQPQGQLEPKDHDRLEKPEQPEEPFRLVERNNLDESKYLQAPLENLERPEQSLEALAPEDHKEPNDGVLPQGPFGPKDSEQQRQPQNALTENHEVEGLLLPKEPFASEDLKQLKEPQELIKPGDYDEPEKSKQPVPNHDVLNESRRPQAPLEIPGRPEQSQEVSRPEDLKEPSDGALPQGPLGPKDSESQQNSLIPGQLEQPQEISIPEDHKKPNDGALPQGSFVPRDPEQLIRLQKPFSSKNHETLDESRHPQGPLKIPRQPELPHVVSSPEDRKEPSDGRLPQGPFGLKDPEPQQNSFRSENNELKGSLLSKESFRPKDPEQAIQLQKPFNSQGSLEIPGQIEQPQEVSIPEDHKEPNDGVLSQGPFGPKYPEQSIQLEKPFSSEDQDRPNESRYPQGPLRIPEQPGQSQVLTPEIYKETEESRLPQGPFEPEQSREPQEPLGFKGYEGLEQPRLPQRLFTPENHDGLERSQQRQPQEPLYPQELFRPEHFEQWRNLRRLLTPKYQEGPFQLTQGSFGLENRLWPEELKQSQEREETTELKNSREPFGYENFEQVRQAQKDFPFRPENHEGLEKLRHLQSPLGSEIFKRARLPSQEFFRPENYGPEGLRQPQEPFGVFPSLSYRGSQQKFLTEDLEQSKQLYGLYGFNKHDSEEPRQPYNQFASEGSEHYSQDNL